MHSPKINFQAAELEGQFDLLFFHPDASKNINFKHGETWLETKLWEHLQWIECESVLKMPQTTACEGVKTRLANMKFSS